LPKLLKTLSPRKQKDLIFATQSLPGIRLEASINHVFEKGSTVDANRPNYRPILPVYLSHYGTDHKCSDRLICCLTCELLGLLCVTPESGNVICISKHRTFSVCSGI